MPATGGGHIRNMPVLSMKPGSYALGSPCSRAAARSLLATRKRSEAAANLPGLAETIRAARMKIHAGESPPPFQPIERKLEGDTGLYERIRQARARVGWVQED
jgi:hypothetical protein